MHAIGKELREAHTEYRSAMKALGYTEVYRNQYPSEFMGIRARLSDEDFKQLEEFKKVGDVYFDKFLAAVGFNNWLILAPPYSDDITASDIFERDHIALSLGKRDSPIWSGEDIEGLATVDLTIPSEYYKD